jgi:predicted XRE-type DNA-binding protein
VTKFLVKKGQVRRITEIPKGTPGKRASLKVTRGSRNVFADIGIPNAEEHLLKAELVRRIAMAMKEQGLTQSAAAEVLGVSQPDVSKMLKGHFRQFSVDRLMRFLPALGYNVKVDVRRAAHDPKIEVTGRV